MSRPADHSKKTLESYGWTSVPHDQSVLLKDVSPWDLADYDVADIRIPDTEVARKVNEYVKERLPDSMRVYFYGENVSHQIDTMSSSQS
jgi:cyanamide hydratase